MRRTFAAAALLALVLTGCEMRAEIAVNDDGSGTLGVAFGVEPMMFGTMPGGSDPMLAMRDSLAADGLGWKIEEFREPGLRGFRATVPFRNLEHLSELLAARDAVESTGPFDVGNQGGFGDLLRLEETPGGGWSFEGTGEAPAADLFSADGPLGSTGHFGGEFGEETGSGSGLEGLGFTPDIPALPGGADDLLRFEFHVTLPGERKTTNADEAHVEDGRTTFIWRSGFFDENSRTMRATTDPAPWRPPMLLLWLLLIGGVGGGGFLFVRKRLTGPAQMPPVVLEGLPMFEQRAGEAADGNGAPSYEPVAGLVHQAPVETHTAVATIEPPDDGESLLGELGND